MKKFSHSINQMIDAGMVTTVRPSYIQFYPTMACNMSCGFCFNRHLKPVHDVTIVDFEKILSVLSDFQISSMDILGGEPTLHPDFLDMVDLISAYGLQANISSNGTHVRILKQLSETYQKDLVRIGISVNSNKLEKNLYDYIFTYRPVLKSLMDRRNMIPESCRAFIGLPGIDYFLLYADIVDKDDLDYSMPFYEYYKKLAEMKNSHKGINGVFCSGFIPDAKEHPELEFVRCPAGTTKLSMLPDGSVYPCYLFFQYNRFELGNILRDDFDKIWRNPILDHFRRFDKNRCPKTECELFASCHGGCPAMSFHFYQDLKAPDPRCVQDQFSD